MMRGDDVSGDTAVQMLGFLPFHLASASAQLCFFSSTPFGEQCSMVSLENPNPLMCSQTRS